MPERRASQSKRTHNRRLRRYLNDPNLRVKRSKQTPPSETEIPEGGDWTQLLAPGGIVNYERKGGNDEKVAV